jgi:hypothetical protein
MRRVLGPVVAAGVLAAAASGASVGAVLACEPYTFDDDGFGLERGIAWAFEGRVVREIAGEAGQGPVAVIIEVDRMLTGEASGGELSIAADAGCDGFWYGAGDEVIVAVPRYSGFLAEPGPADRLRPPYAGASDSLVAVWVLDGERVVPGDGPHSWPTIGGIQPQTAADVRSALLGLPDTATDRSATSTLSPRMAGPTIDRVVVLLVVFLSALGIRLLGPRHRRVLVEGGTER